jgi:hypothetical protein
MPVAADADDDHALACGEDEADAVEWRDHVHILS